jgi:hypothetical protein
MLVSLVYYTAFSAVMVLWNYNRIVLGKPLGVADDIIKIGRR